VVKTRNESDKIRQLEKEKRELALWPKMDQSSGNGIERLIDVAKAHYKID